MGLLEVGQLVTSRMGRDSGKRYVVTGFLTDNHVNVADGFVRPVGRPKCKNVRHLVVHDARLNGTLDDKAIRDFLRQHSSAENQGEEGSKDHGQG